MVVQPKTSDKTQVSTPRRRAVLITLAVSLATLFLATTVIPAVMGMPTLMEQDKAQIVDVVYTDEEEPRYVAEELARFSQGGALNVRLHKVDSLAGLTAAIEASDASLLIIAAHGASNAAGPDSGVRFGDQTMGADRLQAALESSDAKRFFLAMCGIDLQSTSDGRPIQSFPEQIDARVAAIAALTEMGEIYSYETVGDLGDDFEHALERQGGMGELFVRSLFPTDPLGPSDQDEESPACRSKQEDCYHQPTDEEQELDRAQAEAGGIGTPGWGLTTRITDMIDQGLLRYTFDEVNGQTRWSFSIGPKDRCVTILTAEGLVMGPLRTALGKAASASQHLMKGWELRADASILGVQGCGELGVYGGSDIETYGGGYARIQVGTWFSMTVKFGWFKVSKSFWAGVYGQLDVQAELVGESGTYELDGWIEMQAFFGVRGNLGFHRAHINVALTEKFHRDFTIPLGWSGGTSNSMQPLPNPGEYISDDGKTRVIENSMTQVLSPANLNALRNDPAKAAALSEAIGQDATQLPVGTTLNLGHPGVCEAFFSGVDCVDTAADDPVVVPASSEGIGTCADTGTFEVYPLPSVRAHGCADVMTSPDIGTSAYAQTDYGGSSVTPWAIETLGVGPWIEEVNEICSCPTVAQTLSVYSIPADRAKMAVQNALLVDLDSNNAIHVYSACEPAEGVHGCASVHTDIVISDDPSDIRDIDVQSMAKKAEHYAVRVARAATDGLDKEVYEWL